MVFSSSVSPVYLKLTKDITKPESRNLLSGFVIDRLT